MKITEQYLNETRDLHFALQELDDEIQSLKEAAISTTAPIRDDVKIQTSGSKDRVGDKVAAYTALEARYTEMQDDYETHRAAVERASMKIPHKEQILIIEFYLLGRSMSEVFEKLFCSRRTAYYLRKSAIKNICEVAA